MHGVSPGVEPKCSQTTPGGANGMSAPSERQFTELWFCTLTMPIQSPNWNTPFVTEPWYEQVSHFPLQGSLIFKVIPSRIHKVKTRRPSKQSLHAPQNSTSRPALLPQRMDLVSSLEAYANGLSHPDWLVRPGVPLRLWGAKLLSVHHLATLPRNLNLPIVITFSLNPTLTPLASCGEKHLVQFL